jgi:tetratricopeptide (TPR) repeat protein
MRALLVGEGRLETNNMTEAVRPMHVANRTVLWFWVGVLVCSSFAAFPSAAKSSASIGRYPGATLSQYGENQMRSAASLADGIDAALNDGKNSEAQGLLRSLLKLKQTNPDILLRIGVAFARKGLYDDATVVFRRCVKDYSTLFEAHYDLALAEFAQRHYSQALSTLNETRARNRREHLALSYMRGKVENAMGLSNEARRDLEIAFSGDPEEENYGLDLGLYYLEHRDYPKAVMVYEQTRKFHLQSDFTGLGLALAQFLAGDDRGSIDTCRQVLSQQPNFAPLRTLLAFGLYMQGSLREAQAVAVEGLKSPSPHPYLYYIDVAISLKLQSKDYKRMLAEISTAERQIPDCSLCYLAQSKIDEARGARGNAIQDLQEAIRLDSNFPEAWYRLGTLYEQMGQRAEAAQARKRFKALKAVKSQRESDMLRSAFVRAMTKGTE